MPPDSSHPGEHVVGLHVPSVRLYGVSGHGVNLSEITDGRLVIYLHSGREAAPGDKLSGGESVRRWAFVEHSLELASAGVKTVVVTRQPWRAQQSFAARHFVQYELLSDPDLKLALELGLPTSKESGRRAYRRPTLAANRKRIERVFDPLLNPDATVGEIRAWLAAGGR